MSLSLRARIVVIASAAMIGAMGVVVVTSARVFADEYTAALQSRSLAIATGLKIQLERMLQFGMRIDEINGFHEQAEATTRTYEGIDFAMVVSPRGELYFHSDPKGGGLTFGKAPILGMLRDGSQGVTELMYRGVNTYSAVVPVRDKQDQHVGSIVVGFRADLVSENVARTKWEAVGLGLVFVGAAILALYVVLSAFVARPLDSLMRTVKLLRESPTDLRRRARVAGNDELGQLGEAFNGLMEELEHTTVSRTDLVAANGELQRVSDALFAQKERAEVTLHSIGDAVITTDASERVQYLNPAAEAITGWSGDEARGLLLSQVLQLRDAATGEAIQTPLARALSENVLVTPAADVELSRRDGTCISIEDSAAPMRDRDGRITGGVVIMRDVTEARRYSRQRLWEATHDVLTGLANRREFEARVQDALAKSRTGGKQHVVCFMDLDQFKVVNDSCGHAAGDELLRSLAAVMGTRVRESDTLARLGGDEFGLLLEGCSLDRAQTIAAELLATVRDFRFSWNGQVFSVGVSIGLAAVTGETVGSDEVLNQADTACYWAKDQGRNRVCVYRAADIDMVARRRETGWVSRINAALAQNRFVLYRQDYQALSDRAGDRDHLEVLLRMVGEDGTHIQPGSFLPAAERYNLMPAIDRWVIREVFSNYHALVATRGGRELTCSINLSAISLGSDGFLDYIQELARQHAMPAESICFEITETAAIKNLPAAAEFITRCKALGFLFALDDFGIGTSSFGYLKQLRVDFLKIDGSFVKNIEYDAVDRAMTETINRIGHIMGIRTVAEYAESASIIGQLREIGVDYAQGYGVCVPKPLLAGLPKARILRAA